MINKETKISDSEWLVMDIIWDNPNIRAYDIIKKLEPTTKWSSKTVRTLITRLVEKGVVGYNKEKFNMYYPIKSKDECLKQETNRFINKVYHGSLGLLVSNFAKSNKLSKADIDMLKEIVDKH